MSDDLQDAIRQVLEENGLPDRVSNRLLMAVLIDIRDGVKANTGTLDTVCEQIEGHEQRIERLEEERAVNPSLMWLLKNRPVPTIKTAAIILILLMLLLTIGQPIAAFVAALLGLPIP
jgi:hypothetical protein